jgi:hypothetical protein
MVMPALQVRTWYASADKAPPAIAVTGNVLHGHAALPPPSDKWDALNAEV